MKGFEWLDQIITFLKHNLINVLVFSVIVIVGIICYTSNTHTRTEQLQRTVSDVQSDLIKALPIDELATYEYTYNSIAKIPKSNKSDEFAYYVSYHGKVRIGIHVPELTPQVNHEAKTVSVTLPPMQILSLTVDASTMEYIFEDKDYETETVIADAYRCCYDDLQRKVETEEHLMETAQESTKQTIQAMLVPLMENKLEGYQLEFREEENE